MSTSLHWIALQTLHLPCPAILSNRLPLRCALTVNPCLALPCASALKVSTSSNKGAVTFHKEALTRLPSWQDTYLRRVASDPSLWQPLALARWPGAWVAVEDLYAGDWHALFLARTHMPVAFPLAADRVSSVTAAQQAQQKQQEQTGGGGAAACAAAAGLVGKSGAGGPPSTVLPAVAFEDVMRQMFSVGQACSR